MSYERRCYILVFYLECGQLFKNESDEGPPSAKLFYAHVIVVRLLPGFVFYPCVLVTGYTLGAVATIIA